MRVLVVDDETNSADGLGRGLEAEGFSVDLAHNGVDGMWRAREVRYDAIILDVDIRHERLHRLSDIARRGQLDADPHADRQGRFVGSGRRPGSRCRRLRHQAHRTCGADGTVASADPAEAARTSHHLAGGRLARRSSHPRGASRTDTGQTDRARVRRPGVPGLEAGAVHSKITILDTVWGRTSKAIPISSRSTSPIYAPKSTSLSGATPSRPSASRYRWCPVASGPKRSLRIRITASTAAVVSSSPLAPWASSCCLTAHSSMSSRRPSGIRPNRSRPTPKRRGGCRRSSPRRHHPVADRGQGGSAVADDDSDEPEGHVPLPVTDSDQIVLIDGDRHIVRSDRLGINGLNHHVVVARPLNSADEAVLRGHRLDGRRCPGRQRLRRPCDLGGRRTILAPRRAHSSGRGIGRGRSDASHRVAGWHR